MTLGEKIKESRKQCGLSQEQLAEKMCVSIYAVAKWETDKGMPEVQSQGTLCRDVCRFEFTQNQGILWEYN